MSSGPQRISSRDNPLLARLRRLAQDPGAYRQLGSLWLEGDHLCRACVARGRLPAQAVVSESGWNDPTLRALAEVAPRIAIVTDALFAQISPLESPARLGFVLEVAGEGRGLQTGVPTVVLDRLQDPGNVGSILRSAAALGVGQVIALQGTAALWSPKVLRAGMGAHFALHLLESITVDGLLALEMPLVATSPHAELSIAGRPLPDPCAWVLGHEGQGVSPELLARCTEVRCIPQPGGEESLNVAAAAAVCFYESLRQRNATV
jgi:TrmH family RNA methyltransferase